MPTSSPSPSTRRAPVDHPILDVLAIRWSSRAIDPDRPVDPAVLQRVLEAARWAPSTGNAQPWRYLVFDDRVPTAREQARECLSPGNAWARRAPTLLLSVAVRSWPARPDKPPKADENPHAQHDVGGASLALCLQATAEGLVTHQMAGFDRTRARARFSVPDDADPVAMIAVGHPGDADALPPELARKEQRARVRRPVGQTAFLGGFEGPGLEAEPTAATHAGGLG